MDSAKDKEGETRIPKKAESKAKKVGKLDSKGIEMKEPVSRKRKAEASVFYDWKKSGVIPRKSGNKKQRK